MTCITGNRFNLCGIHEECQLCNLYLSLVKCSNVSSLSFSYLPSFFNTSYFLRFFSKKKIWQNWFFYFFQLLVAGQATTGTSPPLGTSASSLSPGSSSAGVAPGAVSPNGSAAPGPGSTASGTSCCENGRPIMTDPVSGQTVCSCQYDSARLTLSYPRLSTSGVGVYGTPYPSTDQNPYPSIGVDSSAFYSPLVSTLFIFFN